MERCTTYQGLPVHQLNSAVQHLDELHDDGVDCLGAVLVLDHALVPVLAQLVDGGQAVLDGVALVLLVARGAALDLGEDVVLGLAAGQGEVLAEPGPRRPHEVEEPGHQHEVHQRVEPVRHDGGRVRVPLDRRQEVSQPAILLLRPPPPPAARAAAAAAAVSSGVRCCRRPGGISSALVGIVVSLVPFVGLAVRQAVTAYVLVVVIAFPLAHLVAIREYSVRHDVPLPGLLLLRRKQQVLAFVVHGRGGDGHLI